MGVAYRDTRPFGGLAVRAGGVAEAAAYSLVRRAASDGARPPLAEGVTMEGEELPTLIERSRREFVATFPADYERLSSLADGAAKGHGSALADLQRAAHLLVGRAGILQFLVVARHAAALETVARVEDVRHFDWGAASACLAALREAFVEVRDLVQATLAAPQPGASAPRPLVLVADDDDDQRYLLTRLLQRAGFDVLAAATSDESLALARARKPAAILLDVQMPGQDGFTTCRLLKADPTTASIPLMFLTARSEESVSAAARVAGADDYASKSADPRELIERVRALCARLTPSSD